MRKLGPRYAYIVTGKQDRFLGLNFICTLVGRAVASLICIAGFPLHLTICAVIKLNDGGAALHRCYRTGWSGIPFELLKYRSMKPDAEHLLTLDLKMIVHEGDERLTMIGPWLRCGIDELPQLWNIAKGEMAWIGPRPDPDWMEPHYGPTCRERLNVRPGITGFAQILNSRYLSSAEGFALDVWYLSHRTIWLDLSIIAMTPLFMAGWLSVCQRRLRSLRQNPEFKDLCRKCEQECSILKKILLTSSEFQAALPPNTVVC